MTPKEDILVGVLLMFIPLIALLILELYLACY